MKILVTEDGDEVSTVTNATQAVKEAQRKDILQTKSPQEHSILCQLRFIILG
jgi:hypothetical protein